jgi:phosphoribosylglycinamide formyltransferase-1
VSEAFRLCVLASGTGTNLQAILDQLHGSAGIEVTGVASDKPEAMALSRAREAGLPAEAFPRESHSDRGGREAAMAEWLAALEPDLIVLAGYMQLLTPGFLRRFAERVINVHPALLPSFPGLDAVGQALEHGVKVTGVTVHFVDDGVDSGPIIIQQPIPIPPGGEREALEEEIHRTEHSLLPRAVRMIAEGRVRIDERNPRLVVIDE